MTVPKYGYGRATKKRNALKMWLRVTRPVITERKLPYEVQVVKVMDVILIS
jgi:hypothetical protein